MAPNLRRERASAGLELGIVMSMPQIQFDDRDSIGVIEILQVGAEVHLKTQRGPLELDVGDIVVAGDVEFAPRLEGVDWYFVLVLRGGRVLWMEYHMPGHRALLEAVAARFGESRHDLWVAGTGSGFPRSCVYFPASMRGEPLYDFGRLERRGLRGLIDRVLGEHELTFTLRPRVVDRVAEAGR
jgi:hypothetical protein